MTPRPSVSAIHEAGHIVTAKALGIAVTHVNIIPEAKRTKHTAKTHIRWGRVSRCDAASVCIAGLTSQMKAYGDCDPGEARFDVEEFKRMCPERVQDEVMASTARLLGQHWRDVIALAAEIDKHGMLNRARLQRLGYWWPSSSRGAPVTRTPKRASSGGKHASNRR